MQIGQFWLPEDWEVFGDECVEKGLDLGLLSLSISFLCVLFVSVINIFDESFNSLSLNGNWRVTLDLESKASDVSSESVLNGLGGGLELSSGGKLLIFADSNETHLLSVPEVLECFDHGLALVSSSLN